MFYDDNNCNPRVGVPPESIWAQVIAYTGNLKVNDEGTKIFADDSTDASGFARITFPSFSGCGTVKISVFVSGVGFGYKWPTVRTTDFNADGRVTSPADDYPNVCDLNYDGIVDAHDQVFVTQHLNDWHRNVLFGTLVRRTNMCPTCGPDSYNTLGDGILSWSPTGKALAISVHNLVGDCAVFLVPSDASTGNGLFQFSFPPLTAHDYDPAWSPLGDIIVWDRGPPGAPSENAQVWVTRRNMSMPPQFTQAGGQSLADTDVVLPITILENHAYSMTVLASDPEGDVLTHVAFLLQLGMAFDSGTRTFSWTPPIGTAGNTYYVKFIVTTPSGGADSFIAKISVVTTLPPGAPMARSTAPVPEVGAASVEFATERTVGVVARLEVLDIAGRLVARLEAPSGQRIRWDRRDGTGKPVTPGVYAYRLKVGPSSRTGKLVLTR